MYTRPLTDALGQEPIRAIKRKHLLSIRDDVADTQGNGAAMAFTRAVGAFFTWCVDREIVDASPAARLAKGLPAGTLPTWTEDQFATALAELNEPLRRVVMLAAHTAQRRGDLCAMKWSDFDGHRITITQQKPRKRVTVSIPLLPEMIAELARWRIHARTEFILETARGLPWHPDSVTKMLPVALRKIGLPERLSLHGLRKLAMVRLAMAGCSPHELQAISGHATLAMVQHYTRAVESARLAEQAVGRLAKMQKAQNGQKGD